MNKKNKTIDCYFKKIESRKSGSNLKVGDKDEGNQNSLMDASLGTYTSDDKEDDASERSDDDSLHQSSQFLEIIENSFSHLGTVPPENVQSSLSQTTFPERNLFNNGENATSSKMDYSFSQSFSTSKGRSFKDTTNKDICDRNTTNKLMHFSEHIVLINTKTFNINGSIKAYPSISRDTSVNNRPVILPYCYRKDQLEPCSGDGVTNVDKKIRTKHSKKFNQKKTNTDDKQTFKPHGANGKSINKPSVRNSNVSASANGGGLIACGGGDGGFGGKMEHEGDDSQVNKISEEFNSALHDNFSGDETKTKKTSQPATNASELITNSILQLLSSNNKTPQLLARTIQTYQPYQVDLTGLVEAIEKLPTGEKDMFFNTTLTCILNLVINTSQIITQPIPVLEKRVVGMVTMSQLQASCILANAFMCTFLHPPPSFNSCNFLGLYCTPRENRKSSQLAKLRCFFNYFNRVSAQLDTYDQRGLISIERKCDVRKWDKCDWLMASQSLSSFEVFEEGCIEDATGFLQVDFANKYIGGGVLKSGAVQEEIRFCICSEAIVSCLIAEKMEENECIILRGCERFSSYEGYANSFEFKSDFRDETPRDALGRIETQIVALDAMRFSNNKDNNIRQQQYKEASLLREANKAYCGFSRSPFDLHTTQPPPVATGNWGCGAFNGDPQLKAMLQWVAASVGGRRVRYHTFGGHVLAQGLQELCVLLQKNQCTAGQLFRMLSTYWSPGSKKPSYDLFSHLKHQSRHVCKKNLI